MAKAASRAAMVSFFIRNQQPRPEGRGMLFSYGGCTQGFNTFLTALKGGVLNPFGTNKKVTDTSLIPEPFPVNGSQCLMKNVTENSPCLKLKMLPKL
jgi:hypothetical protein